MVNKTPTYDLNGLNIISTFNGSPDELHPFLEEAIIIRGVKT